MKRNLALLFFVLLKFFLGYVLIHPVYELHRDEFLHLDQADHLAWGYLSVPPLTSWFSVVIRLLGNSEYWVKFFPCFFGALTLAVIWKTIEALGGNLFALVLGACSILLSALLRLNMLFQPNSFEVLAWTLACFCFIRYFQTETPRWLYFAGVALGLGFLNKYNIAFMGVGFLIALMLSVHRRILLRKEAWFSALIALVIIVPNLIWQVANDFPVVHHMKLLKQTQLVNVSASDFIKKQFQYFFGSMHVLIAAFAGLGFYKPLRRYRVFLWSIAITLVLFVLLHAKGYYAIALYPIYIAFGSVVLEKRLVGKAGLILRGISLALPVGFFVLIYPVAFPVDSPEIMKQRVKRHPDLHLSRWEDGKDHDLPQDFADMLGWKELAQHVETGLAALPDTEHTIILCDNYGQAGAINFYKRDKSVKAVTVNADYVNWFDLDKPIVNIILVQESTDDDPQRKRERDFFGSVYKVGEIENSYAREKGTSVYVLKHAKVDVNAILKSEIDEERQSWRE